MRSVNFLRMFHVNMLCISRHSVMWQLCSVKMWRIVVVTRTSDAMKDKMRSDKRLPLWLFTVRRKLICSHVQQWFALALSLSFLPFDRLFIYSVGLSVQSIYALTGCSAQAGQVLNRSSDTMQNNIARINTVFEMSILNLMLRRNHLRWIDGKVEDEAI